MRYFETIFLRKRILKAVSNKKTINKIINFSIPKILNIPVMIAENPILKKINLWVKISIKIRISPKIIHSSQYDNIIYFIYLASVLLLSSDSEFLSLCFGFLIYFLFIRFSP